MNPQGTPTKRLFIIDLGMTIQYGHNLGFLKVLPEGLYDSFADIYVVSPTTVQTQSLAKVQKIHWVPLLQDIYGYDLGIHPAVFHDHQQKTYGNPTFTLMIGFRRLLAKIRLDKSYIFRRLTLILSWLNARSAFSKNINTLFDNFNVGKRDTVLLPSAEYLQLGKLLPLQKKLKFKLITRFVGGLENSPLSMIEKKYLHSRFRKSLFQLPGISFSTETKEYSRYLEKRFGLQSLSITVTYFPVNTTFKGRKDLDTVPKVGIVGSPREEKGLKHYQDIVSEVFRCTDWGFMLQLRNEDSANFTNLSTVYPNRLYLLDANLHEDLFRKTMEKLDALVFPYEPNAYRMRNSAMLSTAMEYEIPIIVLEGSALASVVTETGIGFTYRETSEIPELLKSLVNTHVKSTFNSNKNDFVKTVQRQWLDLIEK